MQRYKYVLFDLDGTVTDPKIGITKSVAYALKHFDKNVEDLDTLTTFIGPPLKDSFMQYCGFSESDAIFAISKYREYFGVNGLYENTVYNGMEGFLKALKSMGKTLIIATSKPTEYAVKILEHFNLLRYFDFVSGSEFNGVRAKKGEVIAYALEQNNITDLSSVIMVGDREHDIIGAKENGIASVGVLYGYGSMEELSSAGADFIADSIEDLDLLFTKCA